MPRNIEIKARIDGDAAVVAVAAAASAIADEGPIEILQDDTFFRCDAGRLKLRALSASAGELIFYRRADQSGPKESFYVRTPVADVAGLRDALALAYGEAGRVKKRRTLFLLGRTRIHVDDVEGLGHFLELEVVLADGERLDSGAAEAENIMARLGICREQLIEEAYVDLLRARRSG